MSACLRRPRGASGGSGALHKGGPREMTIVRQGIRGSGQGSNGRDRRCPLRTVGRSRRQVDNTAATQVVCCMQCTAPPSPGSSQQGPPPPAGMARMRSGVVVDSVTRIRIDAGSRLGPASVRSVRKLLTALQAPCLHAECCVHQRRRAADKRCCRPASTHEGGFTTCVRR
jgi:hypothetical protein